MRISPHRYNVNCVQWKSCENRIVSIIPPGVLPVNYMRCVNKVGCRLKKLKNFRKFSEGVPLFASVPYVMAAGCGPVIPVSTFVWASVSHYGDSFWIVTEYYFYWGAGTHSPHWKVAGLVLLVLLTRAYSCWASGYPIYLNGAKAPVISTRALPDWSMITPDGYSMVNNNNTNTLFKYNVNQWEFLEWAWGKSYCEALRDVHAVASRELVYQILCSTPQLLQTYTGNSSQTQCSFQLKLITIY